MGTYVDVTDATFQAEVLNSDIPVLVDFWAPWCGPCRALAPHLEKLGQAFEGQVKIAKVNVDRNRQYATQLGVQGIPKLILFKEGVQINEITGLPRKPLETLTQLVEKSLD